MYKINSRQFTGPPIDTSYGVVGTIMMNGSCTIASIILQLSVLVFIFKPAFVMIYTCM